MENERLLALHGVSSAKLSGTARVETAGRSTGVKVTLRGASGPPAAAYLAAPERRPVRVELAGDGTGTHGAAFDAHAVFITAGSDGAERIIAEGQRDGLKGSALERARLFVRSDVQSRASRAKLPSAPARTEVARGRAPDFPPRAEGGGTFREAAFDPSAAPDRSDPLRSILSGTQGAFTAPERAQSASMASDLGPKAPSYSAAAGKPVPETAKSATPVVIDAPRVAPMRASGATGRPGADGPAGKAQPPAAQNPAANAQNQMANARNRGSNMPNQVAAVRNRGPNMPNQAGSAQNQMAAAQNQTANAQNQIANAQNPAAAVPNPAAAPNQTANAQNPAANAQNQMAAAQNQTANAQNQTANAQNQAANAQDQASGVQTPASGMQTPMPTAQNPVPSPAPPPPGAGEDNGPLFPGMFSGTSWKRIDRPGARQFYLEGFVVSGGVKYVIHAVPGERQPIPPYRGRGFTRFVRDRYGRGWWLRIRPLFSIRGKHN